MIDVGFISTVGRLRSTDAAQVKALAESIKEVGLLNPITVYQREIIRNGQATQGYGLVAGAHRLEACKLLGWQEVPAVVVDLSGDARIIAECDENLCGSRLTAAEQAMFTAKRKEAYLRLHPETAAGVAGGNARQGAASDKLSFAEDQARKTGADKRTVQRDAGRGQKIIPAALEKIKGTHLDTGVYLDKLKKVAPEKQVETVERDLAAPKSKPESAPAPEPEDRITAKIRREFRKLTKQAQEDEFVGIRRAFHEERVLRRQAQAEIRALKAKVRDLEADDKNAVTARLTKQIEHMRSEMFRANDAAAAKAVAARKAKDEAKALRKKLGEQVVEL